MIYFDNAATGGRKPDTVLSAFTSAARVCANPGRSGHKLSLACAKTVLDCRNALDKHFGGYGFDRVVFTKNCSEALNIAIFGVLKKGDHVLVSCMEHNSVLRPLEALRQANVIQYDVLPLAGEPIDGDTEIDCSALKKLLRPTTKMVIVTSASNVTGAIPDLEKIKAILPKNVLFLVDGAQGGGHFPIKMQGAGIDLFALAGHKGLLGAQGCGALLFSENVDPDPILFGGTGSMSISLDMPDFYPDRLEAGTLAFPAIVSLLEGVRYITTNGQLMQKRIFALTEYLQEGLQTLDNYVIYSKPNPCGIVAFAHKEIQSEYLAEILSEKYDIAIRGGLHCAPLMHKALHTDKDGLARVSFSHFNSKNEIDKLLSALREL